MKKVILVILLGLMALVLAGPVVAQNTCEGECGNSNDSSGDACACGCACDCDCDIFIFFFAKIDPVDTYYYADNDDDDGIDDDIIGNYRQYRCQ